MKSSVVSSYRSLSQLSFDMAHELFGALILKVFNVIQGQYIP